MDQSACLSAVSTTVAKSDPEVATLTHAPAAVTQVVGARAWLSWSGRAYNLASDRVTSKAHEGYGQCGSDYSPFNSITVFIWSDLVKCLGFILQGKVICWIGVMLNRTSALTTRTFINTNKDSYASQLQVWVWYIFHGKVNESTARYCVCFCLSFKYSLFFFFFR